MQPKQAMKERSEEKEIERSDIKKTLQQFIAFGLVGLLNTSVDIIVYWALLQLSVVYIAANAIAYGAGMLNSYIWNSRFTFRIEQVAATRSQPMRKVGRFIAWNGLSLLLSSILMVLFVEVAQLSQLWSKLFTVVIIVAFQFSGMKKWVFRD